MYFVVVDISRCKRIDTPLPRSAFSLGNRCFLLFDGVVTVSVSSFFQLVFFFPSFSCSFPFCRLVCDGDSVTAKHDTTRAWGTTCQRSTFKRSPPRFCNGRKGRKGPRRQLMAPVRTPAAAFIFHCFRASVLSRSAASKSTLCRVTDHAQ